MPTRIRLELLAEKEVELPRFTGYVSRGLLLTMLRRMDPSESERLHEPDARKPYSVTPLRFRARRRTERGYLLDPSAPCRVEFKFMEDEPAATRRPSIISLASSSGPLTKSPSALDPEEQGNVPLN